MQSLNSTDYTIRIMKTIITVKNNTIFQNNLPIILPFSNSDIYIEKSSEFYISFQGTGFTILLNRNQIYIRLEAKYLENTRGLCGTFNYKSSDDFYPPDGFIETNLISFVESYKTNSYCKTPIQNSPCSTFIAVNKIYLNNYFNVSK